MNVNTNTFVSISEANQKSEMFIKKNKEVYSDEE